MKKYISVLVLFGLMLSSCNVFKCKKGDSASKLEGTWELNYISGPKITFDGLYPNGKPTINFDLKEKRVSGSNSCNNFNGKLSIDGNKIDFTQPMAVTKKMCTNNQGEQTFMSTLPKITSYDVTDEGKTLHFISGDIAMMRFTKK